MKKSDYNSKVVNGINDKIGAYQIELANLHADNTYNGLLKRAELMLKIATLYEALK